MIELSEVRKVYKTSAGEVHALRGVSFSLAAGDFGFLVGPSGSGKSTVLHLVGALDRPTSGTVCVAGHNLGALGDRELSEFRRKSVGFVFQSFNLIANLTAVENVLMPLMPLGVSRRDHEEARRLLSAMGLEKRMNHRPNQLSGGEQQRVAIARALFKKPSLVLADEPTGELDSNTGAEIFSLLRKANRDLGCTFLVVTHDTKYISSTDKVFAIRDGILVTA